MPAVLKPLWGRAPGALSILTATTRRPSASAEIGRPVKGDRSGDGVGVGVAVGAGVGVGVGVARGVGVGGAVGRATATAVGLGDAVPPGVVAVGAGGAVDCVGGAEVDGAVDVGGSVAGCVAGIETDVDPSVGMAVATRRRQCHWWCLGRGCHDNYRAARWARRRRSHNRCLRLWRRRRSGVRLRRRSAFAARDGQSGRRCAQRSAQHGAARGASSRGIHWRSLILSVQGLFQFAPTHHSRSAGIGVVRAASAPVSTRNGHRGLWTLRE